MIQPSCLIADKMHESIVPMLRAIGFHVDYLPNISREELLENIHTYTGLIIRSKTAVNAAVIERASKLKFVARAGAGIDQLDVAALEARHITIINAPEGNRDALGEHAVGMLLALFNNIHFADRQVRNGLWDREGNRGVELKNKTVGLIGFGNMGKAFAQRVACFGCEILAYDKYLQNYGTATVKEVPLEEIFKKADVLSLHVPLTEETRGMFNDDFVSRFNNPFYFLNTARGEIALFSAICAGLESGKILGAALDVLENEKINQLSGEQKHFFEALTKSQKVILTPHVAGWTFESYERINQVLVEKIKKMKLKG